MGEIAEMMLDGTLCEGCGEYLGEDLGYPGYCNACAEVQNEIERTPVDKKKGPKPEIEFTTKFAIAFMLKQTRKQLDAIYTLGEQTGALSADAAANLRNARKFITKARNLVK